MKNIKNFSLFPLLLIGVFLVFTISCGKDDPCQHNFPVLSTKDVTEIFQHTAKSGGEITDDGGTTVTARGVCLEYRTNPNNIRQQN